MKKAFLVALCVALLSLLPLDAKAAVDSESFSLRDTVMQQAHDSYLRSQQTAGKPSFHGTCGLMVSHQLYNLKINKRCIVFDGNDHYDYYADRKETTGGYYIQPYSANDYSLKEALLEVTHNGTRDVMNILVGFQWTNTEAGSIYGHVVLINGIVDGTVYFVESFDCALGGVEGTVLTCSIREFARYYDRWTVFEGLIHFGMGTYHDICPQEATDLTVQARFDTILRSEPAVVGQQGCVRLRSVAAGERLWATGIFQAEHALYYRIQTNEGVGFIPAGSVSPLQVNDDGITLSGFALSRRQALGGKPVLTGTVNDPFGTLSSLEVCVTDSQGQLIRRELTEEVSDLSQLRGELYFDLLGPGDYLVEIYVSRSCPMVIGGDVIHNNIRVQLASRQLQVGSDRGEATRAKQSAPENRDGWFRQDGLWYCYENAQPCAGWTEQLGVRYYLNLEGAALTGAQTIEDKQLYFSATGALVTGWLTVDGKTSYRAADGTAVTGWQELEGKLYCFDASGIMLTETEQEKDGKVYVIAADGAATQKQEAQNG